MNELVIVGGVPQGSILGIINNVTVITLHVPFIIIHIISDFLVFLLNIILSLFVNENNLDFVIK